MKSIESFSYLRTKSHQNEAFMINKQELIKSKLIFDILYIIHETASFFSSLGRWHWSRRKLCSSLQISLIWAVYISSDRLGLYSDKCSAVFCPIWPWWQDPITAYITCRSHYRRTCTSVSKSYYTQPVHAEVN